MRTIAIVNQKGGCGKTTTAINLAALYARRGLRTLLVDMDPQSHCAAGLGVPESRIELSIGQALLAEHANFNPAGLVWEVSRNLHLAPSTMTLASLEAPGGGLHTLPDRDRRLESLLHAISPHYDRCLIDCPPTIGLLTFNALRAAREALIPVETGFFALRGAAKQWSTVQRLIEHIGRPIACHLLATLHNDQSRLANNILASLRREFAGQIMPVVVREHEALREAASFGQPVLEYAPQSEACRDFEALADWLEEHGTSRAVHIEVLRGDIDDGSFNPASRAVISLQSGTTTAPTPMIAPPSLGMGSRAAELARRVTDLRCRPRSPIDSLTTDIATAASVTESEAQSLLGAPTPAALATNGSTHHLAHLYGVRLTSRGALFVQPLTDARSICIAGDFNNWSPTEHALQRNDGAAVFERLIDLPPGHYQYRLVVDGRWVADPHNPSQQINAFGETISLLEIPSEHAHACSRAASAP